MKTRGEGIMHILLFLLLLIEGCLMLGVVALSIIVAYFALNSACMYAPPPLCLHVARQNKQLLQMYQRYYQGVRTKL